MSWPRYFTASISRLKRRPWQAGQRTSTSGRKCILTVSIPAPSQRSQRPPGTLNEKCRAVNLRLRASGVAANASRMGVKVSE